MYRTNKKILYALIVAYKNGIINRKPLQKWIDKKYIYQIIVKYMTYIIIFAHLMILLNEGFLFELDSVIRMGHYHIEAYRILNVAFGIPILISLYKVVDYIQKMLYVNRTMKQYSYQPNDIVALDKVTFKVKM